MAWKKELIIDQYVFIIQFKYLLRKLFFFVCVFYFSYSFIFLMSTLFVSFYPVKSSNLRKTLLKEAKMT